MGKHQTKLPFFFENCSFCDKHHSETTKLVVGHTASICAGCVVLCAELAETRNFIVPSVAKRQLFDCPIGLFVSDGGELCLKTEYRTAKGAVEAYIVDSGEFFWGAQPQTVESQLATWVHPVSVSTEASN